MKVKKDVCMLLVLRSGCQSSANNTSRACQHKISSNALKWAECLLDGCQRVWLVVSLEADKIKGKLQLKLLS